ncbi:hypothetical protein LTR36_003882 [Oleoguttula mirabilis]|uniref:Uncharacterized protein n=1 Tax=Oleoguttula mirabilis TaxID=1507867 RepID=A0AAV9JJ25_9PEZI|nr:hypothetical protein LTR36_003882 [Oleoguttula mirabilis]
MADEALSSFTALRESVPGWIASLEAILKTATDRQNEILFESQPVDSPPASARKPSKSSSRRSHRSNRGELETRYAQPDSPEPTLLRPQLPHMTLSDTLRLAQRKRKTVSACSDNHSGPSKFRSRSMVVIFYDGDIQKRFESLVRAIGTCRNAIRKGKMGAKVDRLSRTGSSSSEGGSSGGEDMVVNLGKLGYRSTQPRRTQLVAFGKQDGIEAFDKVDTLLDKGQSLCERAAHQVLRDGDCAVELTTANKHFAEVQTLVEAELPALKKKAEKADERRRRSDERRRAEDELKAREAHMDALDTQEVVASFVPSDGRLEVDMLEADDSDDDEPDFAVKTLHLGKYQMRSSRLLAR